MAPCQIINLDSSLEIDRCRLPLGRWRYPWTLTWRVPSKKTKGVSLVRALWTVDFERRLSLRTFPYARPRRLMLGLPRAVAGLRWFLLGSGMMVVWQGKRCQAALIVKFDCWGLARCVAEGGGGAVKNWAARNHAVSPAK